jgi:hypothetical protein
MTGESQAIEWKWELVVEYTCNGEPCCLVGLALGLNTWAQWPIAQIWLTQRQSPYRMWSYSELELDDNPWCRKVISKAFAR